tara:strand:- start:685 stop:2310 length:1626 start_codon:yes stop_codon:yes gene_type:complete
MIKIILALITLFNLLGCFPNNHKIQILQNFKTEQISAYSSKYLVIDYSISKGDFETVNEILNKYLHNDDLLKYKFYSNLVSGNFNHAYKVSKLITAEEKQNDLYLVPKYILNIKNNKFGENYKISSDNEIFFALKKVDNLVNLWSDIIARKDKFNLNEKLKNASLHELLILENFYDYKELNVIADFIFNNQLLNQNDYLFLAGFYFRHSNLEKFNEIIKTKLSNQLDKKLIAKNFLLKNDVFSQTPNLQVIMSSKLYNIAIEEEKTRDKSKSLKKILLETSLFLCPEMDIAKYSLAEVYMSERLYDISLQKLNTINPKSYYFLAASLKKLSINKLLLERDNYGKLLFQKINIWPENESFLHELANYYKLKKEYKKSLKIYEKLIKKFPNNERLIFLYASNLDKVNKWKQAKNLFLELLKKNPNDTYTLNYVSYKLALRNEDLDYALNLIKKALILDPENGYFLDTIGWVEFKRNNFEESVFYLEKATSLLPNNDEVLDHLGDCYLMLNRTNEAIYEWKKALKFVQDDVLRKKIQIKIKDNE